jgi:hypothetical protein
LIRLNVKSKKDRLLIVLSAVWAIGSLISSLFIMDEGRLEIYQFLIVLILLLTPIIIHWGYRWVTGGEKTEKEKEKDALKEELVYNSPVLVETGRLYGVKKQLILLFIFSLLVLVGFSADIFINQYMIDTAYQYGWGKIPQTAITNVENWSTYTMYFRVFFILAFIITVGITYSDVKEQLVSIGIEGLKCSLGMLIVWTIIPFANLVMPWRAFGALDRAAVYASQNKCGGILWNTKGQKKISIRAIFVSMCFITIGMASIFYNKRLASLEKSTPTEIYGFMRLIDQSNELQILITAVWALFMFSILLFFYFLNRNMEKIKQEILPV